MEIDSKILLLKEEVLDVRGVKFIAEFIGHLDKVSNQFGVLVNQERWATHFPLEKQNKNNYHRSRQILSVALVVTNFRLTNLSVKLISVDFTLQILTMG